MNTESELNYMKFDGVLFTLGAECYPDVVAATSENRVDALAKSRDFICLAGAVAQYALEGISYEFSLLYPRLDELGYSRNVTLDNLSKDLLPVSWVLSICEKFSSAPYILSRGKIDTISKILSDLRPLYLEYAQLNWNMKYKFIRKF